MLKSITSVSGLAGAAVRLLAAGGSVCVVVAVLVAGNVGATVCTDCTGATVFAGAEVSEVTRAPSLIVL